MSSSDLRERIDTFLNDTGLTAQVASVVPLTGDASDRRYYRILLRGAPSQVLAVHPGPIEFARQRRRIAERDGAAGAAHHRPF